MRFLSPEKEQELRKLHRKERDRLVCDRIKAVLLSNKGWTYLMIAEALMIDDQTVSKYIQDYKETGKLNSKAGGSESKLSEYESRSLESYLESNLHVKTSCVCEYVKENFNKNYTISGMRSWMRNHGFVYKKPKGMPAKANAQDQEQFIKWYENLMNKTPDDEPILFGDSVHPTQATKLEYGWIKKGQEHCIPTTGSKTRVNITGAINLETLKVYHREYDKINGASFVEFLKYLEESHPFAPKIHHIVDRGSCHTSKETKAYLEKSRVKLHYLPPYSPNLNPIERLWKGMTD